MSCSPLATGYVVAALETGAFDLALGYFPDLGAQAYFHQRLYTHTYACMMRRGHPLIASRLTDKSNASAGHAVVSSPARSNTLLEQVAEQPTGGRRSLQL